MCSCLEPADRQRVEAGLRACAAPALMLSRPKVAVLREQGVNSHVEMAYAFTAGRF